MASKSKKQTAQLRAQKRKRKQEKRLKQKAKTAKLKTARGSVGQRHQEQLKRMLPTAWAGENQTDVAIFDEAVLATLNAQQQSAVNVVKESLRLIECGQPDQADQAAAAIPRKSELSDWRLLIRGIKFWLASDPVAADKAWHKLDQDRRPTRIARAFQLAHRTDLTELANNTADKRSAQDSTDAEGASSQTPNAALPFDDELLRAAKIIRRMRIDRAAIRIATAGVKQKREYEDEIPNSTISPEKVTWLQEFGRDFRGIEPNLVRALEIAALDRAYRQPYCDGKRPKNC